MTDVLLERMNVGGHSIAFRSAGRGEPLVLLHGFLCESRFWRPQLDDLSRDFRVIAWDAPGAGLSSDPPDPFTFTDWARCLKGLLDAMEVSRASIAGLSWGGGGKGRIHRRGGD